MAGGRKKPPGRPENLAAPRFEPGQSGNPGGRPRELPTFRATCRSIAIEQLPEAKRRLADPGTPTGEWTRLWEALCDRGGLLKVSVQTTAEAQLMGAVIRAIATKVLSREERAKLLAPFAAELAADDAAPAMLDKPDAG